MAPRLMRTGTPGSVCLSKLLCAGLLLASGGANAAAPIYFDLGGLIITVFVLVVAVVFVAAYAVGRWRGVLVAAVIGGAALGWFGLEVGRQVAADRALSDWANLARQACEAESASLPKVVQASSVVDNTASLARTVLLQFFSERALEFVEVKVAEEPFKAKAIFREDCCDSGWIKADWIQKPYVRMKLGKTSDSTCHPELTAPRWQAAPFLPDTCLLVEEIDQPSAAVRIEEQGAKQTEPRASGWVRVVEAKSGQTLAQLTSSTGAGYGFTDRLSQPGDEPRSSDCGAPHRQLAELLRNSQGANPATHPQRLSEIRVRPSVPLDELLVRAPTWPKLEGFIGQQIFLSSEQNSQVFSAGNWAASVEGARKSANGIASDGPKLIDLNKATLTQLDSGQSGFLNWWTNAALNGYFVTNREGRDGERLLARFDRQGKLEWVVNLVFQSPPSIEQSAVFGFQKAVVEGRELVLYDHGRVANGQVSTMALRIPLDRLPRIDGYR